MAAPTPSPQAVYLDLDGTLLGPARELHPSTRATLHALVDRGVRVGLATGRMHASAAPYARAVRANAPLVLFNGAQVVDPDDGRVLLERRLGAQATRDALEIARAHGAHVNLYDRERLVIERVTEVAEASMRKDGVRAEAVGDLRSWGTGEVTKLLLIAKDATLDAIEATLAPALRGRASLVRPEPSYLEVLPAGTSKGAALVRVARVIDIPLARMVAFGDGPNDLEMVEVAGVGVAMGNAHATLKAAADEIIGDHASDTIAVALARLFRLDDVTDPRTPQ